MRTLCIGTLLILHGCVTISTCFPAVGEGRQCTINADVERYLKRLREDTGCWTSHETLTECCILEGLTCAVDRRTFGFDLIDCRRIAAKEAKCDNETTLDFVKKP